MVSAKRIRKATRTSAPSRRPEPPAVPGESLVERIAQKAYELWEQRGRQAGNALQDWLDAETLLKHEAHESRE